MEEIKSLAGIPYQKIHQAFADAFADYEIQLSESQLEVMLKRRGWKPELSFGAFSKGRLVSFTLNGIGNFNGLRTAYDTGTGTIKSFRGKGLASAIFVHSLPFLKEAGIRQYLLEVLQHNTNAVSLYRKLGFQISREFDYFSEEVKNISPGEINLPGGIHIDLIQADQIESLQVFFDFIPSWQNSFEAISRCPEDFTTFAAYSREKIVGFCVFEPVSGDLTLLAVNPEFRRQGLGSALFARALELSKNPAIKAINLDSQHKSLGQFLRTKGVKQQGKQFEMIKAL